MKDKPSYFFYDWWHNNKPIFDLRTAFVHPDSKKFEIFDNNFYKFILTLKRTLAEYHKSLKKVIN